MERAATTPFGHIGYWAAAIAIASMGWTLYLVIAKMDASMREVARTAEVLRDVGETNAALTGAEAAQRGFLLSPSQAFITQRDAALATARERIQVLRRLTSDHPPQQQRLGRLDALLDQRVDLMHENARRREVEGISAVIARISEGGGRDLSAAIFGVTHEIEGEELRRLEQRRLAERRDREEVTKILVWAGVVVVLALIPGYIGFIQQSRSRNRAEDRLRELAETLPGAVVRYRTWPDGRSRYEYLSPNVAAMRGVTLAAALADPQVILRTILDEDRQGLLDALAHGAKTLTPVEHDYRIRAPDGSIRWLRTTAAPHAMRDGSVVWSAFWADVTEKKALVAALNDAKEDAESANRAKGTFLATMSHEIRTPMNGVLGMLELLALTKLDREQRTTLEVIRASGRSLLRIIDDILDFSKIEAGRMELRVEAASIAEIIMRACDVYRGSASSKGLTIHPNLDDRLSPACMVDPVRLQQILGNLVSNAIKFTSQGSVEVRAELVARAGEEEKVRISVRDSGIGISLEDQQKLFAPFAQASTTTGRHGGTGLGLAICRRLADMMGGRLEMQSEPGRGTCMTLTLSVPVADPRELPPAPGVDSTLVPGARVARVSPTPDEAAREGTLVLVVDDHPINRMVLQKQVNALGYAAECADDGAQALEKWATGRYSLLLSDVNMPAIDGYELARRIREREAQGRTRHTILIACTANVLDGEAGKCLAAGVDDYLPKPVQLAHLREVLSRWLPLPQPVTSAPLDPSALEEVAGDDVGLQREIVARFHRENATDAQALERAIQAKVIEEITRCAHRIKGAARTVGAMSLAEACEQLERAGRKNDWDEVSMTAHRFREELARLDAHIASMREASMA